MNTNAMSTPVPQTYARVAGLSYLVIAILGIFSFLFVLSDLIVPGDAAATAANISASEGLFRLSIVAFLVVLVLDVVAGWALYVLLKPVNRHVSLLAAVFRWVYSMIHAIALLSLIFVLQLMDGAGYLAVFETEQLQALMLLFLNGHGYGFLIALLFFGIHLCVLGYLIIRSSYIPRLLGLLLIFAGLGYVVDTSANILLPNYADYTTIFLVIAAVPSLVGELAITFWLLVKDVNVERWEKRALAPTWLAHVEGTGTSS